MSRTIKCANIRDALALRSLLEEQGVQVRQPDEVAPLSMVASGDLDRIKAAVAQLGNEFPRSGPITIEGEPGDDRAPEPSSEPKPTRASELDPAPEPAQAAEPEPPESPGPAHAPDQPEPLPASEPASEGQVWAVLYDGGLSLTTASERIARSLTEAERQRGHRVTVLRLADARPKPISEPEPARASEPAPAPEPVQALEPAQAVVPAQAVEPPPAPGPASEASPPELTREPGPASEASPPELTREPGPASEASPPELTREPGPASEASPPELTREPGPARAPTPTRRRRLLLYALAAASIVVAAAVADHWDVLPRIGADTSSSPAQVGGPAQRMKLLPPLDQPPVMHFSNAVDATPTPAEPSAQPASPAAEPSGAQNTAARPTGSPTPSKSP